MQDFDGFKKTFGSNFWRTITKDSQIPLPYRIEKQKLLHEVYESIKQRTYYPSVPRDYVIADKGKGVARVIPVFEPRDYCVYFYCIRALEDKIAVNRTPNTYGGWSLGGILRESEDYEMEVYKTHYDRYEIAVADDFGLSTYESSFEPNAWRRMFGDFNSKLYGALKLNDPEVILEFDIANFYDNIRLGVLEYRIREIAESSVAEEVSLLFHFLSYWNRKSNLYNPQTVGLPQDEIADCSRILANFYLQEYDKYLFEECNKVGATYFRYADDQIIFGKDKIVLKSILYKASLKLADLGLNINGSKVHFFAKNEFFAQRAFSLFAKIDKNKGDISKLEEVVDEYLAAEKCNYKDSGRMILNKLLWQNIDALPPRKKNMLLAEYTDPKHLTHSRMKADGLKRIYDLLPANEKESFIKTLRELAQSVLHNRFHHMLKKFFLEIGKEIGDIESRIAALRLNHTYTAKVSTAPTSPALKKEIDIGSLATKIAARKSIDLSKKTKARDSRISISLP